MFLLTFIVGMMGFIAMVALGSLRGGHTGSAHAAGGLHASGHLGVGHTHVGTHALGQSGAQRGLAQVKGGTRTQLGTVKAPSLGSRLLSTLSPVNAFSLALGFGATGMIMGNNVSTMSIACSVVGALVFNFAMVQPLMGYLAGFASKPSEGLEGTVYQEAKAITSFDQSGRGLVQLTLDGQYVQLLATLDSLEVDKGIHVKKGEMLVVVEVDSARNACRVTRELAS